MMYIKIIHASTILITLTSAYYNEAPCMDKNGECLPDTMCPSAARKSGLCPTQAYNIMCCVPYSEEACSNQNGICQWNSVTCNGYYSGGLCPTQPGGVKCCISNCGDKYEHALNRIFNFEGGCQNSAADTGNNLYGYIGYTCMGITPGTGWTNRVLFPECYLSFSGNAEMFVKYCYDQDKVAFKGWAKKIYRQQYLATCSSLDEPAFFVCADISVLSGPGTSQRFMAELGNQGSDVKGYARKFNALHREFLKDIVLYNSAKAIFLDGWLRRADDRDVYINNYNC